MIGYDAHEDCARCENCQRHLDATEQWPCLTCGRVLCDVCECVGEHEMEPTC